MFVIRLTNSISSEDLYTKFMTQVQSAGLVLDVESDRILDEHGSCIIAFEMTEELGMYDSVFSELGNEGALYTFLQSRGLNDLKEEIRGEVRHLDSDAAAVDVLEDEAVACSSQAIRPSGFVAALNLVSSCFVRRERAERSGGFMMSPF